MAQQLAASRELVYMKTAFKLPYDTKKPMENVLIGLMTRSTPQAKDILVNKVVFRDNKHSRFFKPLLYRDKIFTSMIKDKLTNDEQKELQQFTKTMNMTAFIRGNMIKTKNIVVDTSPMQDAFINHCMGKNYKTICHSYIEHLMYYLNTTCGELKHKNRYLIIDTAHWGVSEENRTKVASATQRMLNPISIIFYLLKTDPDALKVLDDYQLIVLDQNYGWFRWEIKNRDNKTFRKIFALLAKFKNRDIELDGEDEEDDNADTTPTTQVQDDGDSEPDSEDTQKNEDENTEVEELTPEELELAEKAIEDSFNDIGRSMSENKRMRQLRERQKQIKLDGITLGDSQTEEIDYHIEEVDFSDKIFSPNKTIKKVRFDNSNKSYNANVRTKDIINSFKSLNDRNLPVVITKIERKDSSTAMDLKETWTVKMESADGVKHSVTVDLPKAYDDNYMYLGGNRKQFVNQQILKPLVKIAPDTVQLCTNYNKMFMYRYGDVMSPKAATFKKIILNNPALFKVRRGNCTHLNKGKMTSIEYDTLGREFIEITIRGKGIGLNFDQSFYDKKIANKEIEPIKDGFLYCIWDGRNKANVKAFVCPVNKDVNTEDDLDGPIDVFCHIYKKETGKDFWDLADQKTKPGKRMMYTSCTVMGKKIPTILLLGYFEGLTTVLKKAGIKHRFSDKRERLTDYKESMVEFSDGYLFYERSVEAGLLLSGLSLYDTKGYNYADWDTISPYMDIFAAQYGSRILASGLDAYYDNMIDPITKEVLESMNLPTDFVSLVLCASALLADNQYSSELSLTEFRIRNMEMISAYLYKSIANAYSRYRRTAHNKNPEKISIPKNEVIKNILMSNVVEDVSVLNPIVEKEKQHAITCKGPSGINLDRAYTQAKRCFDSTMTGAMTISTSPDGNCGVVRELTVEPKVINSRGFVDCEQDVKDMKPSRLFGYGELANGIGVSMDDAIRTAMGTKQSEMFALMWW